MESPENASALWRCLLLDSFHGWGSIFLYRGKINKKNDIKLHVSWWQWRLKDVGESHLTEQLTEREWRRPLTWLDRFRDAVLLPASWGDENIQPHVGNRRWNILTSSDYRSFYERSPANVYFSLVKAVLDHVRGRKTFELNIYTSVVFDSSASALLNRSIRPNSPLRRHTWPPSRCWPSPPSPPASSASEGPSRRRCSWQRRTPAGPERPWRSSPSGTCRWLWRTGSWAGSLSGGCWWLSLSARWWCLRSEKGKS